MKFNHDAQKISIRLPHEQTKMCVDEQLRWVPFLTKENGILMNENSSTILYFNIYVFSPLPFLFEFK